METTKALVWSWLVACVSLGTALPATAQTPVVGALAIDERQGDRYGWAVDYETAAAARAAALRECGVGCSVVLTFARCGAYAADQDTDSTAVGWAESFDSAAGARQTALYRVRCPGRFRLYGPSVGLQRPGGGGGAGSEPGRAAADPVWGCGLRVSILAARTVCSVRGRVRRFGTGSRRAGYGRPDIWTARRSKRCAAEADRGLQHLQAPRLRIPGDWKSCSGRCSGCWRRPGWRRCVVRRAIQLRQPGRALADSCRRLPEREPQERVPRYRKRLRTPMHSAQRARCSVPIRRVRIRQDHAGWRFPSGPAVTSGTRFRRRMRL